MVTESAVTLWMTPVVMPHCESHPSLGGKVLQSQVGCVGVWVSGVWVTGVGRGWGVGWRAGVGWGAGADWHAVRNGMAQAVSSRRTDLWGDLWGVNIKRLPRFDWSRSTTQCI
jgi:hypothetical protein